jgi:hypothetical protein
MAAPILRLVAGVDRAHVDVDRARAHPLDDAAGAERRLLHVRRVRHHRDHHVACARDLGRGRPALGAETDQFGHRRLVQVEHGERKALLDHIGRHRPTDRAQADESDPLPFCHRCCLSLSEARYQSV